MIDDALAERLERGVDRAVTGRPLSAEQRRGIIRALLDGLEGLYTHLPQKRARYGLDPIQQLRLLGERVTDPQLDDRRFHAAIGRIFTELRDAHTRYVPPGPPERRAAVLPILVERYTDDDGGTVYTASKVVPTDPAEARAFAAVGFRAGVTITHWNAVPIERAVSNYADLETAGRPDARIGRALESLTIRPLAYVAPPDEDWVVITFETVRHAVREVRLDWRTLDLDEAHDAVQPVEALSRAYNPPAAAAQMSKKMLYAGDVWASERDRPRRAGGPAPGDLDSTVVARTVRIGRRNYGHLRIHNFLVRDDQVFVDHVASLVEGLPDTGLVIDLRANPGGSVWAAEGLLQLFTPNRVSPTLFTLVASDLTRAMARAPQNRHLEPWAASLAGAVSSGASHADPVPLTPPERCNNRGQVYGGPVVAVVDANTYSAGDLFAAGFVDNHIGKLVSTDAATGGGGANVWTSRQVTDALRTTPFEHHDLSGASFTLSVRQALRYGPSRAQIEDVGVEAQFVHRPTRRDVVAEQGNRDLLAFAARILDTEPRSALHLGDLAGGKVAVTASGLDQLLVTVDDVVRSSTEVEPGATVDVEVPVDPADHLVEVAGYRTGQLRQRRRLR